MSTKEFDELDDMIEQTDASLDDSEFDSDLVPEEGFLDRPARKSSSKKSSAPVPFLPSSSGGIALPR